MSNYDRLVHVDKENNVIIKTSLKDEIQAIFNKYSSYAICEKIIFKFHSNGNESRHSLIHKKTGDKTIFFGRGLIARSMMHSVLGYDVSTEFMLRTLFSKIGLHAMNSSVVRSFAYPRKLRKHCLARRSNQEAKVIRNHNFLAARSLLVKQRVDDAGDGHIPGQAIFSDGVNVHARPRSAATSKTSSSKVSVVKRCGNCMEQGHTLSLCDRVDVPRIAKGAKVPPMNSPRCATVGECSPTIIVFDIESTHGSPYQAEVIQIAAAALTFKGFAQLQRGNQIPYLKSSFNMLAKHNLPVQPIVLKKLKGMDWDKLPLMPPFETVMRSFLTFIQEIAMNSLSKSVVLVAHNGKAFDLPTLFHSCSRVDIDLFKELEDAGVDGMIDTLLLSRHKCSVGTAPQTVVTSTSTKMADSKSAALPNNLTSLFEETNLLSAFEGTFTAHDAADDVRALVHVLRFNTRPPFALLRQDLAFRPVIHLADMVTYCSLTAEAHFRKGALLAKELASEAAVGWKIREVFAKPRSMKRKRGSSSTPHPRPPKKVSNSKKVTKKFGNKTRRSSVVAKKRPNRYSGDESSSATSSQSDDLNENEDRAQSSIASDTGDDSGVLSNYESSMEGVTERSPVAPSSNNDSSVAQPRQKRSLKKRRVDDNQHSSTATECDDDCAPEASLSRVQGSMSVESYSKMNASCISKSLTTHNQNNSLVSHGDGVVIVLSDDDIPSQCTNAGSKSLTRDILSGDSGRDASLSAPLTNIHENVYRAMRLVKVAPIHTFMSLDESLPRCPELERSSQTLRQYITSMLETEPHTQILLCATIAPITSTSLICLLPDPKARNIRKFFLNDVVINSYSSVIATRNPRSSVASSFTATLLLSDKKTELEKCRALVYIDFNNDHVLFPIHLPDCEHWALVYVRWSSSQWVISYLDSALSQERGDEVCTAISTNVSLYLRRYRNAIRLSGAFRAHRSKLIDQDELKMALKARASFRREVIEMGKQTDLYNCGSFVLNAIECIASSSVQVKSIPSASSYHTRYRERILLSLCGFNVS